MGCLTIVLLLSGQAMADDLVFTSTNGTSVVLDQFYASPTGVKDWEDDIPGAETLYPGESIQITIADGRRTCTCDLLSTFVDGDKVEESGVDLCNPGSYEIR
ncbi:MAG: hypothetical protein HQL89_18025 [Magnetococcales bacterium]|nr:hypothetical protein [Magnetococcales bacterium]